MTAKKFFKWAGLSVIGLIFVWTFVFLYQKSQPAVKVYELHQPEVTDLIKSTVATGKVEPRDEVLIKPQISGIIDEVYKEAGEQIRKGEVIAKVKVIPELGTLNGAESRVRLAEINARQAETDFSRTKELYAATYPWNQARQIVEDSVDGISETEVNADDQVTVYNLQGLKLLDQAPRSALKRLPAGLYIVNGRVVRLK